MHCKEDCPTRLLAMRERAVGGGATLAAARLWRRRGVGDCVAIPALRRQRGVQMCGPGRYNPESCSHVSKASNNFKMFEIAD